MSQGGVVDYANAGYEEDREMTPAERIASQFIYKLNAMEHASQADHPDKMGYADKRKAVLDYVVELEAEVARLRLPPDETMSAHPGCAYCMGAGTPVRPGQVCPECGDRLPTKREYEANELEAKLAQAHADINAIMPQPCCMKFETCDNEHCVPRLKAKLARYEQAERELPEEPQFVQQLRRSARLESESLDAGFIHYVDKLRDAAAALKVKNDKLQFSWAGCSLQLKDAIEDLEATEAALATARQQAIEECAKELDRLCARDKALANNETGTVGFGITASFAAAYNDAARMLRALGEQEVWHEDQTN